MMLTTEDYNSLINRETASAIKGGWNAAHKQWRMMVLETIYELAHDVEDFTMDDIRYLVKIEEVRTGLKTQDNRAMGGAAMTAKSLGWIKRSGHEIRSRVGHGTPLQIWISCLYR